MQESHADAYAASGVDITAGYRAVELMREHIARTLTPGAGDIGGFGGLFEIDTSHMKRPCLVSGTDGVGTKIRIAQLMGRHNTVGIDCVAMCVNDIVCTGANPMFFLDYIAIGHNDPEKVAEIVAGVAEGCVQAGCALIGGETAEHPGLMAPEEYDIAGFSVGIVDREDALSPERVREGDVLVGLLSSGLHSNGFSLVRRVFDVETADLGAYTEELGVPLAEELLRPTRIYVKPVLRAIRTGGVHAAAHITGGGFVENLPRAFPAGLEARIEPGSWRIPPIFTVIQKRTGMDTREMYNTFNMGCGMVLICEKIAVEDVLRALEEESTPACVIGDVVRRSA